MSNYFEQTQYVSNSDLGYLQDLIWLKPEKDLSQYYNFGTLIDAIVTEPHKVDWDNRKVLSLSFNEDEWNVAIAMNEASKQDKMLRLMCVVADKQKEVYVEEFEIEYEGYVFMIPAKVKLDFYMQMLAAGGDLKSTVCTTYKAFLDAIDLFDYDRQAAWYIDIANLTQFVIVGISKKVNRKGKHDIFKHVIKKGDEMYLNGKRKYSKLAWFYKTLILNLNLS